MSNTTENQVVIPERPKLIEEIQEKLTEEKWTRVTIESYSKKNFLALDELIKKAEEENLKRDLEDLCLEHLSHSPKSIIALYIIGILSYKEEVLDDSYLFEIVSLFKENRKWNLVEYLAEKILAYGENKLALQVLEECYEKTTQPEPLLHIWERLAKVDYENGEVPRKLGVYYEKAEKELESIFYYKMALKRFVRRNQSHRIEEEIWRKLSQSIPEDLEFFFYIEKEIAKQDPEKSARLLSQLLFFYEENEDYDSMVKVLKKILSYLPKDKGFRDQLIDSLRAKNKDHSQLEDYIERSGLSKYSQDIRQCLEKFERYIVFDRDHYVHHRSWGIGKIIDFKEDSLVVDFELKQNHMMSLKIALSSLKSLSEDHIWIQKRKNPKLLIQDDPEKMKDALIMILKSYNKQVSVKEIRKEMSDLLEGTSWNRWWNKAKQLMKTSSIFGLSPNKRDLYFLRDKPLTFEEESFSNFSNSSNFDQKFSIFLDYLKHSENYDSESFQQMLHYFVELLGNQFDNQRSIKSFLLLRKLKKEHPNILFELRLKPQDILSLEKEELIEIYNQLTDTEFRKDLLDILRKNDPTWTETFLWILKEAKATRTHQNILEELLEKGQTEEVQKVFEHIIAQYRTHPENYFWMAKTLLLDTPLISKLNFDKRKLTFYLFHCMDFLNKEIMAKRSTKLNRKLLTQIVDMLLKEKIFEEYIKKVSETEAYKVLVLVNALNFLDEKTRSEFLLPTFLKFPGLAKEESDLQEELHPFLVTQLSYERKQKELQHILNVEIPNNSKAIGIAQERGDLRENADYIAALEQQKQLQKIASTLTDELNRVKILKSEDVDSRTVNPGTKVQVLNRDTQKEETYTLLGEWESNMEKGIISYKSPFGRTLFGAKREETVIFDHGDLKKRYTILKIEKVKDLP